MGREWKIGDPVDYSTDGWMDAQNWGHGFDEENSDDGHNQSLSQNPQIAEYSKKAMYFYREFNEEEALYYINKALNLNRRHAGNWNIKAIILEGMEIFAESEKCYNRSLELSPVNLVYDNKARMLRRWSWHLLENSKDLSNGLNMLDEANNILMRAIKALPGENSEEDLDKYFKLRDSINFYIDYEKKFQRNLREVKKYDSKNLFTLTNGNNYKWGVNLYSGMPLKLVREPENEFDSDAIAVYAENKKIGYVQIVSIQNLTLLPLHLN